MPDITLGNYEIDEDSNGNLVIKDKNDTVVFQYDDASSTFQPQVEFDFGSNDISNVGSLNTTDGTVGGFPMSKGIGFDDTITEHIGNLVTVSADSFQTIFDVAPDTVDVIGGQIVGQRPTRLDVQYVGGGRRFYSNFAMVGQDTSDNNFGVIMIPHLENVERLRFKNDASTSQEYGYGVLTT